MFVATETELLISSLGLRLWHTPDRDLLSSRDVLDGMPPSDMPRTRRLAHRRTLPSETLDADTDEHDRAAAKLSVRARTLLRLLHDWPLSRVSQLQRMADSYRYQPGRPDYQGHNHRNSHAANEPSADVTKGTRVARTANGKLYGPSGLRTVSFQFTFSMLTILSSLTRDTRYCHTGLQDCTNCQVTAEFSASRPKLELESAPICRESDYGNLAKS